MNVLVSFHTPINAGYAMSKLERTFFEVMKEVSGAEKNIYFSFSSFDGEKSTSLPDGFNNIFELNSQKIKDSQCFNEKLAFIKNKNIELAFCFDLQVSGYQVDLLRKAGVKTVISYWGSTISDVNYGIKLWLKKIEVMLRRNKPNLFIFESEAMRNHATNGRGINKNRTTVIQTGVDTDILKPEPSLREYVINEFGIPSDRKVAIYSGHMERRKGVHVIIDAFKYLLADLKNDSWHMLICGNRPGEEEIFLDMLKSHNAENHVTFCGYRNDLPKLMPGCDLGIIASTGWDSFPMSSLEMAACGLPILASDLQGLTETIEDKKTGFLFEPGNHAQLAKLINQLGEDMQLHAKLSSAARQRIVDRFSTKIQKQRLLSAIENILHKS